MENSELSIKEQSEQNCNENTQVYGDAIQELSIYGSGRNAWKQITSAFITINSPFIFKGGCYYSDISSSWEFTTNVGAPGYRSGFRAIICPL